ncbi:MAG: alpha/beta hydrolase [Aeromicrobium sp.]|uniref:alpha/beta hydrolase n=1 Tax=Aeromicrobium sp. TaxID=1871063 RepID=UPI0039E2B620
MANHLTVAAEAEFRPGASWRSQALGFGLKHSVKPLLDVWARLPFDLFPPNVLEHAARLLPAPNGTRWRPVRLEHCRSEYVIGPGVADTPGEGPVILYLHGGAFLTCGINTHRRLVARVSSAADRPALNVGYRQMPHEPVAESVADGLEGLRWLLAQGYRIEDVTIVGDSAGGYLAFAVARAAIDAGLGRPAGVVALSPLLDFDNARRLAHRNADRCQLFSVRALERFEQVTHRLDTRRGVSGRRTCPVNMSLDDMPPSMIQIGSREVLLADAELMASRLVSAGVPCDLTVWDRQVHVFQAAASWVPEARAAIDEIGEFIASLDGRDSTTAPVTRTPVRTSRRRRAASSA